MAWHDSYPRAQLTQLPRVEVPGDWYTVVRPLPGVYALCEPRHFQEVISFLFVGETAALLLDTGMGCAPIRPVVEALTDLPLTVVNTHCHFDHMGGNWEFPFVWAWDTEVTRRRSQEGWAPEDGDENYQPGAFLPPEPERTDGRLSPYTFRPLSEGQTFDLGGQVWQVIHTPGHSPDGVMLFCQERKILCTGDTLYPATLYAWEDPATYAATMRALKGRFTDYTLLCSHNEPLRPGSFLDRAADALSAMMEGKTAVTPAGKGLWQHRWEDFEILSSISG